MNIQEVFQHLSMPKLNITCLASCTLGLKEYEVEAYLTLLKKGAMTVGELAKNINKSRPSAQRILGELLGKGLVYRRREIFLNGGYVYYYSAIPAEKFREKMLKNLEEWYKRAGEIIKEMPIELEDDKIEQ
ncbi:MAG: MarR family transcriptional regulator [Candidatus Odinarchaeum yellowstonii]|uniref:MarR family transcriptional regulator n=1 Tax=Odinarchaeota yellowstonii (strain LCB_4) TaxID=1841599 RepID=A0AAF0D3B8_ODILC|nr:MAG: MarR family transcriptional regulator [Candidatus Odinarchaeum yellowstonii]